MSGPIVVSVILCALQCQPTNLRIWDGDTFRVGSYRGESVRILNIDAPEIEGRCRFEVNLAQESKRRLADLLDGQRVQIRRQNKDRYGRTLAVISVKGKDIGDQLVGEGLARTWIGRREPWCR
jgi:micrococcal nuclease